MLRNLRHIEMMTFLIASDSLLKCFFYFLKDLVWRFMLTFENTVNILDSYFKDSYPLNSIIPTFKILQIHFKLVADFFLYYVDVRHFYLSVSDTGARRVSVYVSQLHMHKLDWPWKNIYKMNYTLSTVTINCAIDYHFILLKMSFCAWKLIHFVYLYESNIHVIREIHTCSHILISRFWASPIYNTLCLCHSRYLVPCLQIITLSSLGTKFFVLGLYLPICRIHN